MHALFYIIAFVTLLLCEIIYFRIARRLHIGDKVTSRSSHKHYTITGGGIIFILAAIIFYIYNTSALPQNFGNMLVGATILAIISFIDDIRNVSPYIRLIIHSFIVATVFSYILQWGYIDIFIIVLICGVGLINAYNFMDGINGIMAGYSLVTLGTLYYCYYTTPEIPLTFIALLIIATGIFTFFNFRKKAICFAGDIGSIVMGFFILYLMVELIWLRCNASCLVFLIVYGIDTVFTIIQRLFMGENILLPHRRHLYQVFVNQWHIPHYQVSLGYASTQLFINIIYFLIPEQFQWSYVIIVTILLSALYFIAKRSVKSLKH